MCGQWAADPAITFSRAPEVLYLDLEADLATRFQRQRNAIPPPLVARHALAGANVSIEGVVREHRGGVDVFGTLGLPRTALSAAALGPFGREPIDQVTIHTGSLLDGQRLSYTGWISSRAWKRSGAYVGALVQAGLEAVKIVGKTTRWHCRSVKLVGAQA